MSLRNGDLDARSNHHILRKAFVVITDGDTHLICGPWGKINSEQ